MSFEFEQALASGLPTTFNTMNIGVIVAFLCNNISIISDGLLSPTVRIYHLLKHPKISRSSVGTLPLSNLRQAISD